MQNNDLFVNVSIRTSDGLSKPKDVMQKYQQQRMHHLPLGGMIGERIAKSMTLYNSEGRNNSEPDLTNETRATHKISASAIRSGARMSLDMSSSGAQFGGMKLDARRTSMEQLPQRSSIFKMAGGEKVGRSNFEQHKADPMARTQMHFGSLNPNTDFGPVTIESRPLIPKK